MTTSATASPPQPAASLREYAWAPLASLTTASAPAVDVYASQPGTGPALLWKGNARLGDDHLNELRRYAGQFSFWVARRDFPRVASAVREHWPAIAGNRRLSACDRLALCEMAYSSQFNALWSATTTRPFVTLAMRIAAELTPILLEGPVSSLELFYAIQYLSTPSARLLHIAGYVLQIARLTGMSDPAELECMVVGALVHDLGARDVNVDVWGASRRWTAEERELVHRHPQVGYEALQEANLLAREPLLMAYQHHERADGSGYPVGILLKEIHPWARALAIADRFQTLTAGRGYRPALSLDEAVEKLRNEADVLFDREMTPCWIQSLRPN